jgi:sulfate adenylyltransferase
MGEDSQVRSSSHVQDLLVDDVRARAIQADLVRAGSYQLTPPQLATLELLLTGALAPLGGYLARRDLEHVRLDGRLADGTAWPVPVTLEVPGDSAGARRVGETIALRDPEGVAIAALRVADSWQDEAGRWQVGGRVEGLRLPEHHDHAVLRRTPARIRATIADRGWQRAVAYRPGAVLHRGHAAALVRLSRKIDAGILVLASGGLSSVEDAEWFGRLRALEVAVAEMRDRAALALVPLQEAGGPPRDRLLLTAVVARNCGCSHLAVEQADLSVFGPDPEEITWRARELGVEMVVQPRSAWCVAGREFVEIAGDATAAVPCPAADEVVAALLEGQPPPDWLLSPGQRAALERAFPPRIKRGFTVFLTGLSGSGKSTIANVLRVQLLERTGRPVTLLDGDLVRTHLSSELGFSREHRDLNILRIGFVAAEITRHGGIAVCCPIAPYDVLRKRVRAMISRHGGFLLVHVATSLEECERRDRKGLYARARAGLIPQFTGISDPYEPPADAEVTVHTETIPPGEAAATVMARLFHLGYLSDASDVAQS